MPQSIEIPGEGVVEFPDGMDDDQISTAIRQNFPSLQSTAERDPGDPDPLAASSVRTAPPSIPPQDFNWGDVSARIAAGLAENTALMGQGAISAVETAFPNAASAMGADTARDFLRSIQDRAKEDYLVNRERDTQFVSKVAGGVSSLPPIIATAGAAPLAAAALIGESFKQDAELHGGDQQQQSTSFMTGAATGLLSEALLGLPALLRSARAAGASDEVVKGMARQVIEQGLKNSGRGAAQESVEQLAQNFTANTIAGYDPERKTTEGVGESALIGAITEGPVGTVTQAAVISDKARIDAEMNKLLAETPEAPSETPNQENPLSEADLAEYQQLSASDDLRGSDLERWRQLTARQTARARAATDSTPQTPSSTTQAPTEATPPTSEAASQIQTEGETENQTLLPEEQPAGSGARLGPGAANIEEFGPPNLTSTKNAVVDEERTKRGELPLMRPAKEALGTVWNAAEEKIDREPDYPRMLVDRLRSGEKTDVSQTDEAILLHEKIRVDNEQKMAADRALDQNSTEEERAEARLAFAEHTARLNEIDEATQTAGTIWGRTGRFRQVMARDDFTLSNMVRKVRMANDGKELTPEQYAKIQGLQKRIADLEKQLAERETKKDEVESTKTADEKVAELKKEARQKDPETPEKARARITDSMKARVKDGDALTDMRAYVQQLALGFVRSGVDKRDALVDAVHSVLQTIDSGITRRQSMDLISGYGDLRQLDKEQAKQTLRDLKGQLQQVGKLEDITSRQPPKKTGVERRTPSDEERRLIREVNEAKKKFGVVTTDPATQLRSALDAIKTRLKNQIRDLAAQFELGKPEKGREPIEYDEQAQRLRELRDRIKATLVDVEGSPEMTDEQRVKIAKRALAESIAEYERRIREKDIIPTRKESRTPKTAELEAMRARRDALRSEFQLLQDLDTSLQELKKEEAIFAQIEKLQQQLASGDVAPTARTSTVDTEAVTELKRERDTLRQQRDELRNGPKKTEEERKIAQLDKRIEELEKKVAAGDISVKTGTPTVATKEVAARQARAAELRAQITELRKQAKPKKTAEEIALQAYKTRTKNQIAEIQERIAKGDFAKRPKRELALDKEATDLKFKAAKVKEEFARGVFDMDLKNRSVPKKLFDSAKEVLNLSRAIITSVDLSAVFRQGNFAVFSHPIKALKAVPDMLRAFASEKEAFRIDEEIANRDNAPLYKKAGLYLSEPNNHLPSRMEEAYMARWLNRSELKPGETVKNAAKTAKNMATAPVRGSARAFTTFLNKLRADVFDTMAESFASGKPTTQQAKDIAQFVNAATGRGTLGPGNQWAAGLNTVLWSPKLLASRFQLLLGHPIWAAKDARARKIIAKEYAKFLTGAAVVYALAMAAQDDDDPAIELDPRSSDFLKVRFGNTRLDPLGGLIQVTVLASRLYKGSKKTGAGKIVPITDTPEQRIPYGGDDWADVTLDFVRSKMTPTLGAVFNAKSGRNVVGEQTDWGTELSGLAIPLSLRGIKDTMEEQGVPRGTALTILNLFGMGVQTYDTEKKK